MDRREFLKCLGLAPAVGLGVVAMAGEESPRWWITNIDTLKKIERENYMVPKMHVGTMRINIPDGTKGLPIIKSNDTWIPTEKLQTRINEAQANILFEMKNNAR